MSDETEPEASVGDVRPAGGREPDDPREMAEWWKERWGHQAKRATAYAEALREVLALMPSDEWIDGDYPEAWIQHAAIRSGAFRKAIAALLVATRDDDAEPRAADRTSPRVACDALAHPDDAARPQESAANTIEACAHGFLVCEVCAAERERERCARVADAAYPMASAGTTRGEIWRRHAANGIAAMIRARSLAAGATSEPQATKRLKCSACDALRTLAVRHRIPHEATDDCATYETSPEAPHDR